MKYKTETMLYLLLLFTITQLIGLTITQHYQTTELPYQLETPEMKGGASITYLLSGVVIMTVLFYLLIKLKYEKLIKLWFSIAIILSLSISLNTFLDSMTSLIIALIITTIRLTNKDLYIHNLTELLIYGGIVTIFKPLFNPLSALILLIIISIYDYISVFITKHMIYMAKSQNSENLFTGLIIKNKGDTAILGGGDIAFSLLFASVIGSAYSMINAYLTIYLVLISLTILMLLGKKGKFYPAMPFITTACAISYLITII